MKKIRLAGFIMTFNRPEILEVTIKEVFNQMLAPDKILIVDNSTNEETRHLIQQISDNRLEYLKVGHNSGPAGAAKIGLQQLSKEGYDWIYWGDDDDPPLFSDAFKVLFELISQQPEAPGVVGAVGHFFNTKRGEIERVADNKLVDTESLKIDSIAGNQCMLVNADVIRAGVLPDEKLFFGFEELDFCLKVKKAGFDLLVSPSLFLRSRIMFDRVDYKRPLYIVKEENELKRQYYSTRNMLYILGDRGYYRAYAYQFAKALLKSFYGFRHGMSYGYRNLIMIGTGMLHSLLGKKGKYF